MAKTKIEHKLWLYVIGTMVIIATLWGAVFYPQSLKKSGTQSQGNFSIFKEKISNAFSVLKKSPASAPGGQADEVDALRERVFGDSTKKIKP